MDAVNGLGSVIPADGAFGTVRTSSTSAPDDLKSNFLYSDDRTDLDASAPENRTLWNASSNLAFSAFPQSRSLVDDVNGIDGINGVDGDEASVDALMKNMTQTPQIKDAVTQLSDNGTRAIVSLADELRAAKTPEQIDAVEKKNRQLTKMLDGRREDIMNDPNASPEYKRQMVYVTESLQKTNNSLAQMIDKKRASL